MQYGQSHRGLGILGLAAEEISYLSGGYMRVIGIVFGLILAGQFAFAATIHVPADQPAIQAGIAEAENGDTVLVAPGTYMGTGNVNIDFRGQAVVVRGETGSGWIIIDCQESGCGFLVHLGEDSLTV